MSVRVGTRLDGRYRLSDRIAVGGMGEVWRGMDDVLGRPVAVKILRSELAEDDAFRRRFRAEARTAGSLPHNGIAAVFDYGETSVGPDGVSPSRAQVQGDGIAYLIMELVPGEALSAILARDGALGVDRTLRLLAQAARALHAAHLRGVIHRDVKPANLMVTPEGRVKVTDFGIARPLDHEPLTMTGQVMGTAHYLAPELARGMDASPLSDVYALGVVIYECLAGHRPFDGDNQVLVATAHLSQQPPPLPGTIPPNVVALVGAAMEKDPARRIQSAERLAVAMERLLARDPAALEGVVRRPGGTGLSAAQAPPPVPDVPPPPPTAPRRPRGGPATGRTGVNRPAMDPAARTVTMAGPPGSTTAPNVSVPSRWAPPPTAPDGLRTEDGHRSGTGDNPRTGAFAGGPAPGTNSTAGTTGTTGTTRPRSSASRSGAGGHGGASLLMRLRQLPPPTLALIVILALVVVGGLITLLAQTRDTSPTSRTTPGPAATSSLPPPAATSQQRTVEPTASSRTRTSRATRSGAAAAPTASVTPTGSPTRPASPSPSRSKSPTPRPTSPSVTPTSTGGGSVPPSTPPPPAPSPAAGGTPANGTVGPFGAAISSFSGQG